MSAGNDLRPFLHDATYDAERAARLIRQLMLFHKDEETSHLRIDALDLLREVADVCRGVFPRDIDFHVDAPERLPALRGHRDQLRQCIVNLCANARDAIAAKADGDSGGTRRIELRAAALRADQTPSVAPRERGQAWPICESMSSTAVSAWMEPHASGSLSPSSRPSPLPAPPASDWQPPQSPSLFRIQTEQMMGDVHQEIVHCIFACLSADHQKPWALNDLSL